MSPADASGPASSAPRADFVDHPMELGRGTTTLLVGVLTRAATLSAITGAQAVASMIAGLAALGRSVAETVEGRHMRDALDRGRLSENLDLLFGRLGLGALASASPPTPMLEDFFNDVALVLAPDISESVDAALASVFEGSGIGILRSAEPVDPVDFLVGLWAFASEVAATLSDVIQAGPLLDRVTSADEQAAGQGRMLR
ncbi:hypothetical protein AB0H36_41840 [Kribbella sp. NPDC050820]|uniref:hypothetical protein n=1 Tax=Kribbella sp. NPDC050820 TaxID=3155408 RepID=UPI0033F0EE01